MPDLQVMKNNYMKINKHNYEEFFLLYTDNELNSEERKAVEDFVEMYPGLKEELNAVLQTRLSEEESLPSFNKNLLYRSEAATGAIDTTNYESYFLLYADNELTEQERSQVENFAATHTGKKAELDLLMRVKLQPEAEVVFKDKSVLYRHEKPVVAIRFQWRRMVAAASIILTGALFWTNFERIKERFNTPAQHHARLSSVDSSPKAGTDGMVDNKNIQAGLPAEQASQTIKEEPSKSLLVAKAVEEKKQTSEKTDKEIEVPAMADNNTEARAMVMPLAVNNPKQNTPDLPVTVNEVLEERKISNTLKPAVKPVILDQAAFNGDDDNKRNEELALLDTDNTEKKSKGPFRGLLRKASRFVNRATNADDMEGKESIVRIASFEIAKK